MCWNIKYWVTPCLERRDFRWTMTRVKCWRKLLSGELAAGPPPCTRLGGPERGVLWLSLQSQCSSRRLLTLKAWDPYHQGEWRHFPRIQHPHQGLITPTKSAEKTPNVHTHTHTHTHICTHILHCDTHNTCTGIQDHTHADTPTRTRRVGGATNTSTILLLAETHFG